MTELNSVRSALKMDSVYFEEMLFKRQSCKSNAEEGTVEFGVEGPIVNGDSFSMLLKARASVEGLYQLNLSLHGNFSVAGGLAEDNMYLTTNAVAIMFPYLRSQLTLMTTQPGLSPIILPPVNVNKLMKRHNEKQS